MTRIREEVNDGCEVLFSVAYVNFFLCVCYQDYIEMVAAIAVKLTLYTVSKKRTNCSFDKHGLICIIFDK